MEIEENAAAVQDGNPEYLRCTAVLEQERELVAKIAGMQDLIRKAVMNRQWLDFESHMAVLGQIGARFEDLDRERVRIFASFTGDGVAPEKAGEDAAGFYALAACFPADERKAITGVYRNLKMETMKVRIENDALINYLGEASLLITDFLDAAFPDRKGKIYSRSGSQVQADMRSMVLNRHF
ncbi:MAG: hypothetical protein LBH57_04760 [Treponema sp.]|jgi:hypothetical protein|nr:hypothetical protein [Treponema sp.]